MLKRVGALIFFCAIIVLSAPLVLLAADEGVEYTVKKGDTLWDISSGNLKDPFLWPKLWKANPQIHNPHLIYPNDKIVIPAELLKEEAREGDRVISDAKAPETTTPKSLSTIARKSMVSREALLESGYFVKNIEPTANILGSPYNKTLLGTDDAVYISTQRKVNTGKKFYVITKPEAVLNPLNRSEIAGYHVQIKGIVTVTGDENGKTKATISEAYKEIAVGDSLIDYYHIVLPTAPSVERKPSIAGIVLRVWNKRSISGKDDVIYINKGTQEGVEIGDIFTITSRKNPQPVLGTAQVFSVSDAGSAATVRNAISEIVPGDTFGN